jgi:3-hydroxyisobutyrate dehydrogenase
MKIAFVGLGTMGAPMAARLLAAGFDVTVHNRTREREEPLAALGASRAATPREAAAGAELLFTNVSDTADVREVLLGEDGAAAGLAAGSTVIDMSTISPSASRELAALLADRGVQMLDAPVSGGSEGAQSGTLSIMVGGDADTLQRALPALQVLGSTITHVGPAGSGQVAKAMNQVLIAGTYATLAEGIVLGLRAGLDMDATLGALAGGAARSWCLENRAPNMVADSYPLGFRTRLHRKDLGIALETGRELGVALPVTAFVEQLETSLIAQGFGEEDVSNLARAVRQLSGLATAGSGSQEG